MLVLTLGCILAVTEGNPFGDMSGVGHPVRLADLDPGGGLSLAGLAPPKALSQALDSAAGSNGAAMPFDNSDRPGPGRGTGERAINLPPAVLWLIGINVAVHLLRSLLGEPTDDAIILQFGLVPAAYTGGSQRPADRSCWRRSPTSSCMAAGCISASTW